MRGNLKMRYAPESRSVYVFDYSTYYESSRMQAFSVLGALSEVSAARPQGLAVTHSRNTGRTVYSVPASGWQAPGDTKLGSNPERAPSFHR